MKHGKRKATAVVVLVSILISGFLILGRSEGLAPVEGQLIVPNNPTALFRCNYGRIWLHSDSTRGNHFPGCPIAELRPDGGFKVFTNGRPGAPVGWYRVTILAIEQNERVGSAKAKQFVLTPPHYSEASTSGLSFEVLTTAPPRHYDLVLQ